MDYFRLGASGFDGELGELLNRKFARVSLFAGAKSQSMTRALLAWQRYDVDWPDGLFLIHKSDEAVDKIVDEAERARLRAFPVNGDVLTVDCLHEKVRYDSAVIRVHARPVRVEDPGDADVDACRRRQGPHASALG